ncbi:uncharacterized protein BcabD6B2_33240 [Babesia caballi]|uniref:Membrane protein, putative n=1 Tax=Babesia caballi TaxID=5871 RepID=A0AAV4LVT3_BABCB|nr:membrane protein, putative [Babesia caballi]
MTEEKLEKIAKKPLLLDLNSKMKDRAIDVVKQNMKHTVLYRIKDKYRETHYINQLLCGDIDIIINLPEEEEGYPNDSIIYVHFQERDTRAKVVVYYRKKMKVYLEDYISAAEDINKFMQVRGAKLPNLFRPIHIDTVLLQEHVMVKMMMQNAAGVSLVTPAHSAKVSVTKRGEEKNDGFFVTWKFEYTIPSDKISDVVYVDFKVDKGNFSLPDVSSDIFIKKAIYEEGQYRVDAADEDEFEYTLRTRYLVIDDERQHILRNLFVLDKENPTLAKDYLILYNNVTSEMSCAVVNAAFADGSWIVGNYIVERFDLPSTNFISAQAVIPIKGDSRPVVYPENMS